MVGWHHRLPGHGFEQILGDNEGQGRLACCGPCSFKESDVTCDGTVNSSRTYSVSGVTDLRIWAVPKCHGVDKCEAN